MSTFNKYKRYIVSKSSNGGKIVYLARYGKSKRLIGRAATEGALIAQMKKAAEEVDKKEEERLKALENKESDAKKKAKKKVGLWKPGGLLKKKSESSQEKESKIESLDDI